MPDETSRSSDEKGHKRAIQVSLSATSQFIPPDTPANRAASVISSPSALPPDETETRPRVPRHAAVLICHGMGQQVRFETLDSVARMLLQADGRKASASVQLGGAGDVNVELLRDVDGTLVPCAQVLLGNSHGTPKLPAPDAVAVDVFEAYWAPLTEGEVGLWDTLSFLLRAGVNGCRFALIDGVFDRWMFGSRQEFRIPARALFALLIALWGVLSFGGFLATYAGLFITECLRALNAPWPSGDVSVRLVAGAGALFVQILLIMLVGAIASRLVQEFQHSSNAPHRATARSDTVGALRPRLLLRIGALLIALMTIAAVSKYGLLYLYRRIIESQMSAAWEQGAARDGRVVLLGAILLLGALVFAGARFFLVQFVGDVAAYVSAYKVSRFERLRHDIQEVGRRAMRFIYRREGSHGLMYDSVYVVGHSLGSLIAYDALDDALNWDAHESASGGNSTNPYAVAKRTKILLTLGSPLDKTAFIFRTQKHKAFFEIREALAAAMQPLIADYGNRPTKWINLWSPWDWISGSLQYYDSPRPDDTRQKHEGESLAPDSYESKRVLNIRHRGSTNPLLAHVDYWTKPLLRDTLYAAITRRVAAETSERDHPHILEIINDLQ